MEDSTPVIGFCGVDVTSREGRRLLAFEVPCFTIENHGYAKHPSHKKIFLAEIEQILLDSDYNVWYRDLLVGGQLSIMSKYLLSHGATAEVISPIIIDLARDESELKKDLRKSYKSLINWGAREMNPIILNNTTLSWENMLEFRELHIRESGRETRSVESWRRQYDVVKAGKGFVVVGRIDNKLMSAGLFFYDENSCYYQVSASRRDEFDKPLFHAILWTAIIQSKEIGCDWFEVGEHYYENIYKLVSLSQKDFNIGKFKAGFGGEIYPALDIKHKGTFI